MGSSVDVKLERVTWTDKDQSVAGTSTLSTTRHGVANRSFTVPVEVTNQYYAYRLQVTPTSTGIQRKGIGRSTGDEYQVYGPRGDRIGRVNVPEGSSLGSAVREICPRPGVFFAKQGTQVRAVVVGP